MDPTWTGCFFVCKGFTPKKKWFNLFLGTNKLMKNPVLVSFKALFQMNQ